MPIWDCTDTADLMAQETEWFTFEWTEREDRCERCGGGMEQRRMDLHLAGGRVILRDVPLYICRTPGCGNTQLPSVIGELADRVEALVQETLTVQRAAQLAAVPEPALVREDRPPYHEEEESEEIAL